MRLIRFQTEPNRIDQNQPVRIQWGLQQTGAYMDAVKEQGVGRFSVEVELANNDDMVRAGDGMISPQ